MSFSLPDKFGTLKGWECWQISWLYRIPLSVGAANSDACMNKIINQWTLPIMQETAHSFILCFQFLTHFNTIDEVWKKEKWLGGGKRRSGGKREKHCAGCAFQNMDLQSPFSYNLFQVHLKLEKLERKKSTWTKIWNH